MSRKFLVLSALALGLIVPASAKTYTRDEAIKTAMENSSDIKTAEEELIKASSQVESGYGNAYPSIDLSANVTRIFGLDDVKKTSALTDAAKDMADEKDDAGYPKANAYDQNVIGPALDGMTYGMKSQAYRWQSSVGLTVTQILYAAGKVGTAIDIAKAYKHLEEVNLEDKKSSIRYDVDSLFNNLILLDSSIAITEEGIKQIEENLNIATQKFQSGSGKEIDMIRAQLELESQRSDLEKTKKLRILAKNALLNKMGLDWDSEVQFVGELRMPEANLPYPDTAMTNVKKRRRELAMLEATEKMREKFPHNPTADILVSPSCPIIIWSTIEKDACSILCKVTGIAILHNDFINFDIIISSYFLFLLTQPATQFLSHIPRHRALLQGT